MTKNKTNFFFYFLKSCKKIKFHLFKFFFSEYRMRLKRERIFILFFFFFIKTLNLTIVHAFLYMKQQYGVKSERVSSSFILHIRKRKCKI